MIVVRHPVVSCDPLLLTLCASRPFDREDVIRIEHLSQAIVAQLLAEQHEPMTFAPSVEIAPQSHATEVRIRAYWLGDDFLGRLSDAIEGRFPWIERLEVGLPVSVPVRDDDKYIAVPATALELQAGLAVQVAPFQIAKYPVSIGQYSEFVDATSYRSVAERRGDEFCFRDYPAITMIPEDLRLSFRADYLSHEDAVAYCRWAVRRLPTEPEWLAAAVLDTKIYVRETAIERRKELLQEDRALLDVGAEITSTETDDGKIVVRKGPHLFRWTFGDSPPSDRGFRLTVTKRSYEDLCFRVCKLA